uniref:Secologanin synthase-like protein n=1 Tax=Amsonia hubrichtii TaxID=946328 RepID=U5NH77_9GENT|nr:secologanin synthase-like protein [Amsonia hubrichtii]
MEMDMDIIRKAIAASVFALVLAWAWRVLDWAWFTPKRLEKRLRQQGYKGNAYRFLVGDVKENGKMLQEAMSKPMAFNNDIVPRIMPHIHHTIQTYGRNSFTWMGRIPRIHVMEPELIKEVLTHSSKYQKNFDVHNPLVKFLLTGVGSFEGAKWSKHRRIISPAFTLEKLKTMLPAFAISYDDMLRKWEKIAEKQGSHEVDIFPTFDVLTSDVISKVAFGSTYEEGGKIFQLLKELMDLTIECMRDVYIPGWSYLPTKRNKRMREINKELTDMLRNIINKRTKALKAGEPGEDDLLGVLLESNFQEIQKQGNKKNVGMTINDVIEECKLFYFAGQETTGVLLTWATILLSKHPEWQERAREEVLQAFGKNKPDFERLNHLKYVSMILYEVLRLYPPVIDLTKIVHEDTKLGPYTIPAGTQVMLPTVILHREKSIWGEDAMEFNPMRFADGVANATKNNVTYLPFSWGPRVCLGQNFALLQAKLGLAMILQRFTFDVSPSYAHAPFTILTLQPQLGSHVIYKKLES